MKTDFDTTFATNSFTAYEQFVAQLLHSRELIDVYLAELRKVLHLFGGLVKLDLTYVFIGRTSTGCLLDTIWVRHPNLQK